MKKATKAKAVKKATKTKPNINVKIVLDRSGSMSACATEVIGGFNHYIEGLKKDKKANYKVHLVKFDDVIETVYKDLKLKDVPELTDKVFEPRGMTALNDAIGKTIVESGDIKKGNAVLFVVFTDGAENASKEYSVAKVKELIKDRESKGNWTITYVGSDLNSQSHAISYGISTNNFLQSKGGSVGVRRAMVSLVNATATYSSNVASAPAGAAAASCNFFVDEKKKNGEA